jgi:hypothetical protein
MDMQHDHDHEHDHSAHAGNATTTSEGMDMSSHDASMGHGGGMTHDAGVFERPDGSYYYTHGAFLGHVVPGSMFVLLGTWWLLSLYWEWLTVTAHRRRPFISRAWYKVPFGPPKLRDLPLEPILMVVLPLFGILGELWLGHPSFRHLYKDDGKFYVDNINDWQHSAMYSAFGSSAAVNLIGYYITELPASTERAFLSLAFLIQGVLLVFHLKGPPIEILVHLILVLIIFATFAAIMVEIANPYSILAAALRPYLTILQGVWWIQTAYIMYDSNPAWNPFYMGASMMAPASFCMHMLWIAIACLCTLLIVRFLYTIITGQEVSFRTTTTAAATMHRTMAMRADGGGSKGNGIISNGGWGVKNGGGNGMFNLGDDDDDEELGGSVTREGVGALEMSSLIPQNSR